MLRRKRNFRRFGAQQVRITGASGKGGCAALRPADIGRHAPLTKIFRFGARVQTQARHAGRSAIPSTRSGTSCRITSSAAVRELEAGSPGALCFRNNVSENRKAVSPYRVQAVGQGRRCALPTFSMAGARPGSKGSHCWILFFSRAFPPRGKRFSGAFPEAASRAPAFRRDNR